MIERAHLVVLAITTSRPRYHPTYECLGINKAGLRSIIRAGSTHSTLALCNHLRDDLQFRLG